MKFRLAAGLLVAMVIAPSLATGAQGSVPAQPKAWVDQPLPGAIVTLPLTPVTIHAASDAGVATIRFFVDGFAAADIPAPAGDLVTVNWTWALPSPGEHQLMVLAKSVDGFVSDPVTVAITFLGTAKPTPAPTAGATPTSTATAMPTATARPTPTPTPMLTPTPTPSPTPPPTPPPTPCTPPAPDLLIPANGSRLGTANPTFEWTYLDAPSCQPTRFVIQIATDRAFGSVVLSDTTPGDQLYWTAPEGLVACVIYYWRVRPVSAAGSLGPSSNVWTFDVIGRACP